jgi:penicillin-binding protein 2
VWGISGVEKAYENVVRGENGARPFVEDAAGRELGEAFSSDLLPGFQHRNAVAGKDLLLGIDAKVQEAAEASFVHPAGAVVAMDPNNGDVLALVSRPEYSPEEFVRGVSSRYWQQLTKDPLNPLYDRALRGLYPPGSTFKIFTAAAALEENVTNEQDTVFCPGYYQLGRETKRCWKAGGHGTVNFHRAVVESCDVYFYEMGRRLGIERIAKYAKGFGMGTETGIGINREVDGLVPTEAWKQRVYKQPWVGGETLSVAIGQGALQVTPLQLAAAVSAVVNGGTLYRPRITLRAQRRNGQEAQVFQPVTRGKMVLTEAHRQAILKALGGVVNEVGGTAYWSARSSVVPIGGKTGTAQVVGRRSGIKIEDHAWFVAFAPIDNPKIVVSVIVENGGHGGTVAAPIARKVIEAFLGGTS